ncbi:hypothetical protein RYX36_006990 [Vicia faba]
MKSFIRNRENRREFPPLMPCLAQTQILASHMTYVLKRYYTDMGRLIIKEDKVKHHEYFHAHRENGNKFDEGGPAGVEDSDAVNQKGSLEEVNIDGATENINQKDSCLNVNFEGEAVSEDAIVNITLDGTTEHVVCDQDDILDDTNYLVSVQTDSVAEGLICNQEDGEALECNK